MAALHDVSRNGKPFAWEVLAKDLAEAPACTELLCIAEASDLGLRRGLEGAAGRPLAWEDLVVAGGRVLAAVRPTPCPPPRDETVLSFMRADHERILSLLDGLVEASSAGEANAFSARLALLDRLLRRHVVLEETHIIPIIAARHGQPRGPAAVLRDEHLGVVELLDDLGEAVAEGDDALLPTLGERARDLAVLLQTHAALEEELVYGLADHHLDPEERASLLDFCRALR